jgi:hypothetical protein
VQSGPAVRVEIARRARRARVLAHGRRAHAERRRDVAVQDRKRSRTAPCFGGSALSPVRAPLARSPRDREERPLGVGTCHVRRGARRLFTARA